MKKLLIAAVILAAAVACGEASSSSQGHQPLALSDGSAQQAPDKSTAALPPGQTTYAPNQPAPMPIQGPLVIRLAKLGKVQNEHIGGQDVSAQFVDLQARLANAEAQRNAMVALLQRAQSVSDIIAIQNQLGQITQQIEQLKGQIQYLDHNTSFSTVTVNIVEAGAPAPAAANDNWGFVTAISDAAHNFVTTINYLITGLGAIGPVLLLLALAYFVWRRLGSPMWRRA